MRRGRCCITTLPDEAAHKPLDWVQRQFTAARPNPLWVADITHVPTWSGFVEAGFNASVGSVDDAYDNALAETINGLYKAEVIHKHGPWKGLDDVERATLTWVEWFNHRRLLRPIGDVPPAEYEMLYYQTESSEAA